MSSIFNYGSYTGNDQDTPAPNPYGLPVLNPINPAPGGYGGITINPINTGYTNPFNLVPSTPPPATTQPVTAPPVYTITPKPTPPATTQPVYQPSAVQEPVYQPATTQPVSVSDPRNYLLTQIELEMPAALGNGGVLFTRAQLDVPNVSEADLQFILAFLLDTRSYMGDLQAANILLFQKEVIDDVTRGTDPQNAVTKARGAIKANIYLYDTTTGNPLYDDNGKPVQTATGTPTKGNNTIIWVGLGLLVLTAVK